MFALVLLRIGDGGDRRNDTALGRDARLVLCTLNKLRANMCKFGRFEHRVQARTAAGVAKRSECDDNHCNDDRNRNITMPTSRIEPTAASRPAANVAKCAIVLEL